MPLRAAEPALKDGDLVAICGDSITAQQIYSLYLQQYFMLCQPKANIATLQCGWSGEKAPSFGARLENDILSFKPSVVTVFYGMNDGLYNRVDPKTLAAFRDGLQDSVRKLKAGGVSTIVVASPGIVDPASYKRPSSTAEEYNQTLAALRDAAREVAASEGVRFADIHAAMMDALAKAHAKLGENYAISGDGVHPTPNGHLPIAYALLKALGVDGDIGTLTVDFKTGAAQGSPGHNVKGFKGGVLEIESARYPFCFSGTETDASARAMSAFVPFNEELNRYRLVVKNAPAHTRVTWGDASKEFTAAQLAQGINLAAEFPDNPFSKPFEEAGKIMSKQQGSEVVQVRATINMIGQLRKYLPEGIGHYDALTQILVSKTEAARTPSRDAVKPVAHQIRIAAAE